MNDEIVGQTDIAQRLKMQRGTVYQWRQRGIFPPPDGTLNQGSIPWWWWATVEAWAVETGRLP